VTPRHVVALSIAAIGFVWLHAWTVPQTLEDEDSVNMALGVEDFDVARYAPHPPGYPVYIALAKASTATVGWLRPEWSRDRRAAAGLAWLSILAGGLGVFAFAALWRGLGVSPWWATLAGIGTAAAPLYWFTAARPLTDTPGLVAAVAIQAALLHGLRRLPVQATLPPSLVAGALCAGLAIGLRSQTMWMTLPLLAWVLITMVRGDRRAHAAIVGGASVVGVLIWFVPLVQLTGGLDEYRRVLGGQGQHDFAGVPMLATNPSWALLKQDLIQTFVTPWQLARLPWLVLAVAAIGLVRLATRGDRQTMGLMVALVLPYLSFHVLFHEVESIRYALPPVAMVAGLVVIAMSGLGRVAGTTLAAAAVIAGLSVIQPITAAYAGGAPVFRVIADIEAARRTTGTRPQLEAHHRAWWATSRALDWHSRRSPLSPPPLINSGESLRLVEFWRSGAATQIWFLSDPLRTDLARFAPASTRHQNTYRLAAGTESLFGGLRTYEVGWWQLDAPAWMLGRGWALTPELAAEPRTPRGATAYLRRQAGATRVMVGMRHTDAAQPGAEVSASFDGQEIDRWAVEPGEALTRSIELPCDFRQGPGAYATLLFSTSGPLVFDQFDAAADDAPLLAFGRGWSAIEFNPSAPSITWRRASQRSLIQVQHGGSPLRLRLQGTAVLNERAVPSQVMVFAGDTLVGTFVADGLFDVTFGVSPAVLDAAGGEVTIAADLDPYGDAGLRFTKVAVAR
jgi:hypothetical protein